MMSVPRGRGLIRWGLFASAIAGVCLVWLVVLPRVGQWESVRQRIDRNREAGIEGGAMFYSELGRVRGVRLRYRDGRWVRESFTIGS